MMPTGAAKAGMGVDAGDVNADGKTGLRCHQF